MKLSALAAFTFVVAMLYGCASKQPSIPDWVSGESSQYNNTQYMIGHGQATTQEAARDSARVDLSKIFQVSVAAESEDVQKFKTDAEGSADYESQASRRISTHTEQIIRGIQIAEMWQDPAGQSFHVLAVLPRLQTATSLRQQIGQLDEETAHHIEQSRKNTDLFLKIAAANLAVAVQQERQSLQRSLQVVDITGRGVDEKWNGGKLKSDLEALLKRVRITSQVAAGSTLGLEDVMAGALAHAGFLIETGEKPDFVLHAQMKLDDLGFKDGWYWQRGVLEIALAEAASNRIRGTKRWTIKGNAPDPESAAKRALNQADTVLKQELKDAIIDMANSKTP